MLKRFAVVALAAVAAAGTVALAASPASAAPVFKDSVHITGNYDSGNHGPWARLDYIRTTTAVRTGANSWKVTVNDKGSFTTLAGKPSPEAGTPIAHTVKGELAGTYAFTVTATGNGLPSGRRVHSAYNFRCNFNGSGNRATDCPGMPASTDKWPSLYFGTSATVTPGAWSWVYGTPKPGSNSGCERWVNSSRGDAGDITGKVCRPSRPAHHGSHGSTHGSHGTHTRTVTPTRPVVRQPTCTLPGAIITPALHGVTYYLVDGGHAVNLTYRSPYAVSAGSHTVRAVSTAGVRRTTTWTLIVNGAPWYCGHPAPTPTHTA